MTKFQFVKINVLNSKLKALYDERASLESDIEFIRFMGGSGPLSKKRKESLIYCIENINKIKLKIERIIDQEKDEVAKTILYLRYIKGLTFQDISDKINYSISFVSKKLLKYKDYCSS